MSDSDDELRRHDPDRYFAALFAPDAVRRDLLTLYAFNTEIARIGEIVREQMIGDIRLAWWLEIIRGIEAGMLESRGPVKGLARIVNQHGLPRHVLEGMIEARRDHDLGPEPIETWAQFEAYADRTAGGVLTLAARITGAGTSSDEALVAAGRAWALTGHLRSLSTNLKRHKLFLPVELFAKHHLNVEDIFHGRSDASLRPAIDEAVARAHDYLRTLRDKWKRASKRAFPAVAYLTVAPLYLAQMTAPSGNPALATPEIPDYRRIGRLLISSITKRL